MNQQDQTTEGTTAPDTIEVQNVNHFAGLVHGWHSNATAMIRHLLTVPDGQPVQIGDDSKPDAVVKELTLTGDVLEAFKLGVEMALMQVASLPFVVELEQPAAEEAAPEAQAEGG